MKLLSAAVLVAAALLATCATTAVAQSDSTPTGITLPSSSVASKADASVAVHTNLQILGSGEGMSGALQPFGAPFPGFFYETPASIAFPSTGFSLPRRVVTRMSSL